MPIDLKRRKNDSQYFFDRSEIGLDAKNRNCGIAERGEEHVV
jgi:hypothetical protein